MWRILARLGMGLKQLGGQAVRRRPRELKLCEVLQLGEHRMLAVIAFHDRRFLIGASGGSMSLLAALPASVESMARAESSFEEAA